MRVEPRLQAWRWPRAARTASRSLSRVEQHMFDTQLHTPALGDLVSSMSYATTTRENGETYKFRDGCEGHGNFFFPSARKKGEPKIDMFFVAARLFMHFCWFCTLYPFCFAVKPKRTHILRQPAAAGQSLWSFHGLMPPRAMCAREACRTAGNSELKAFSNRTETCVRATNMNRTHVKRST